MKAGAIFWFLAVVFSCASSAALFAADSPAPIISHIQREPIASNAITAVGYSTRLHALEIEFRNGAIYGYLNVPPSVHGALIAAPSKARFTMKIFAANIVRFTSVRGRNNFCVSSRTDRSGRSLF